MTSALLLIDIQNDYFPGGRMEVPGSIAAVRNARQVLSLFREQAATVIHVQHISVRPGASFFLPDTDGAAVHPDVAPIAGETVITKHFPNSFRYTPLRSLLREQAIERLVVAGMMTHMCIDATVRAAFDFGLTCTVLHDACAARDLCFANKTVPAGQVQTAFLAALAGVYAELVTTSDYLTEAQR